MSDGPHRSLPMRPGWKRVAERGSNSAFTTEQIAAAIVPALEQDCRAELASGFLDDMSAVFQAQENSLFKEDLTPLLEDLRRSAGCGIGRVFLDNVIQFSASAAADLNVLARAMTAALIDRAACGARQVEEHYLRKSTTPRAQDTRARIEQSVGLSAIEALAKQILKMSAGSSPRPALREQGLDEGVRL
jgi:hypothetical protein